MRRRSAPVMLLALGVAFAGSPVLAEVRRPMIVVLVHVKESAMSGRVEALVEGLREVGYV